VDTPSLPVEPSSELALRRFKRLFWGLIAAYLLLIYTHHGDFWPFSKFPMFSRSGKPWTVAFVREVSSADLAKPLLEVSEQELPGQQFLLHSSHMNQDDLSAVIRPMLKGMTAEHAAQLASYFQQQRATRNLVLYAARGARAEGTVLVSFRPLAILTPEGVTPVPPPPAPEQP
jgi:hypothetical protein